MSLPLAILVLVAVTGLFWLTLRTMVREIKTGVPHLFFSPHPAYENRPINRRSPFLWFSIVLRIFGVIGLGLMVIVSAAFLLEAIGVIY